MVPDEKPVALLLAPPPKPNVEGLLAAGCPKSEPEFVLLLFVEEKPPNPVLVVVPKPPGLAPNGEELVVVDPKPVDGVRCVEEGWARRAKSRE